VVARWLRALADWLFIPIARAVARTGISANMVTVLGTIIAAAGCYYIGVGRLVMGALIVAGGMIFDSLDGAVAKVTEKVSRGGAFLDSTLDRVSDASLMTGVAFFYMRGPGVIRAETVVLTDLELGPAPVVESGFVLSLAALVVGFLISYVRARAESLGFDCKVGLMERAPRAIIVILGVFFEGLGFPTLIPALVLLIVLSSGTLVHRFAHVWKQARTA
jgi:CDP-diacylglycerol--glycerol-3-phosphate 3-phosphatidyltransferase